MMCIAAGDVSEQIMFIRAYRRLDGVINCR
jgi:hypothetical protein